MAFEPVYSLFSPSYPVNLAEGQAVIEARLIPQGYSVGKVLSASAEVSVTCGEVFTGEARYSGKANFRVLVLDGDGICRSLDYVAEFTDKLTGDGITAGSQPVLECSVLDTDIALATEQEIKLVCVAQVRLMGVGSGDIRCLTDGGEGIYTHDDRLNYTRLGAKGSESQPVTDTANAGDVDELLFCEPRCTVVKRVANIDMISVEGVIITDITARKGDSIVSIRHETPFTCELAAIGTHSSDICFVGATVSSCSAELIGGESASVALSYTLMLNYCTYSEDSVNPVCDAFSVSNELLISGESIKMPVPLCEDMFFERVEGKVTLDESMPAADRILAVCGSRLSITGAEAADGKLTAEGMVACGVVYATEDGQKASAAVELPFSITVSAPLKEGDTVTAKGIVTDVTVKVRRDGELDIKADIAVEYSACREEVKYVISQLDLGEERALPTGAVAIHIARKGETLWEAAKALGTTPENVLLQNPGIALPLSGGERIVTYRCLSGK